MNRLAFAFAAVLTLLGISSAATAQKSFSLHRESVIRFVGKTEGVKAITRKDAFINSLTRFDLQSRLKTDKKVSNADFMSFISAEVKDWEPKTIERISKAIESIKGRMKPFDIPFPKEVLFVNTTGKEEGGAAYCRGNAVVLPDSLLNRIGPRLEGLLIHELFHILSVQNPKLRDELYQIVGFHRCKEIPLPQSLKHRKITNPDAPTLTHFMELKDEDQPARKIVPLLYASVEQYDPEEGGSFFKYLTFKLLVVKEKAKGELVPVLNNKKEPEFVDPKESKSFRKQIGNNTNYIFHADEILADNFVILIMGQEDVKTPRIIDGMREKLTKN